MRVAVVVTHVGVPRTLASTSFIAALMDGLGRLGLRARVFGLAENELGWRPEALGGCEAVAPWLAASAPRARDRLAAARVGIIGDDVNGPVAANSEEGDWYLELLLQRSLEEFADADPDLTVMVYPRSSRYLGMVCRLAKRLNWKVLVFATEALTDRQIDPDTRDAYVACVVQCADAVWSVSSHLAEYWAAHGVASERILVRPSIVSAAAFVDDPPPRSSSVIYLGNLAHREVEDLIGISESVKRAVPGYHLAVYGDGTDEMRSEIVERIRSRGLAGTISIEAPVPPYEVPQILAGADVLVLPRAKGEFSSAGFPKKLGEYLATGRPVVVTRVGDIPRYVVDGESAFLVDPDDSAAFSGALTHALTDAILANRVGAAGRRFAEVELASRSVAQRVVAFVEDTPERDQRPRSDWGGWPAWIRIVRELGVVAAEGIGRAAHRVAYTNSGHTRIVAFKMAVVRALEILRIRQPRD